MNFGSVGQSRSAPEPRQSAIFVRAGKSAVADDIGDQDCLVGRPSAVRVRWVQRSILALIAANPDGVWTTEDLCLAE